MWPRITELLLGVWLLLTPAILGETDAYERFRIVDTVSGAVVVALSLASFRRRTARAHLATAALAIALALFAYAGSARPGPPGAQNEITVGLLLFMFAIIPNGANEPPRPWRVGR